MTAVRQFRSRHGISPKERFDAVAGVRADAIDAVASQADAAVRLAGVALEVVDAAGEKRPGWTTVTFDGGFVQLPPGLFDVAAERDRLAKQRADVEGTLERSARKLANDGFTAKAAPDVVAQERAKHDRLATQLAEIDVQLAELG